VKGEIVLRINRFIGSIFAVVLLGVSACGGSNGDEGAAPGGDSGQEQRSDAGGSPGLDGIPEVVAEVNGREISKDEFVAMYQARRQQMAGQSQALDGEIGEEKLKKQVADSMVSTELLVQEADRRSFSVSDEQVNQTLQGLAAQNGVESVDAFLAALEQQGLGRGQVESQVRVQVKIEHLVADEAGDIRPSGQEVRALYKQLVAQQEQAGGEGGGSAVPPLKQVRPQLEKQLVSQKQAEVAQSLLSALRDEAEIVINL
jgi:hypothetical protein